MNVPVVHGGSYSGRIWRYRGTCVETLFFHIWFIPVLPIGGVTTRALEIRGVYGRRPTRLRLRSVLAAYLRVWPILAFVGMSASWWGAWWWYAKWNGGLGLAAMAVGLVGVGWLLGIRAPTDHRREIDAWLIAEGE